MTMPPHVAFRTVLICLSLVGVGGSAASQTVYRCGAAGNQYSAQPCDGGRPVDVSDARSAEQIADARNGVAAQRRLAMAMARERSEAQRAHAPALAGAIGPSAPVARQAGGTTPSRRAMRKKPDGAASIGAAGEHFVAVVPGSGKPAKRKKTQP